MFQLLLLAWAAYSAYIILGRIFGFLFPARLPPSPPPQFNVAFKLTPHHMAAVSGWTLKILRWIPHIPILGAWFLNLQSHMLKMGYPLLHAFDFRDEPGILQSTSGAICHAAALAEPGPRELPKDEVICNWPASRNPGFQFAGFDSYIAAYKSGKVTPVDVAKRVLKAVVASNKGPDALNAIVNLDSQDFLSQAEQSWKRYQEGKTLSEFDGIPITIKDEIDVAGYPTFVGTSFLGKEGNKTKDAIVVARLRAKGFLIAGKANMFEIGIQPFGYNKTWGHVKTPYDTQCCSGGSSSGSAAAVSSGIVPCAIGNDGGGSIRVPAAFCGVVGLKANVHRVPEGGVFPLCFSVGHMGPIATNIKDVVSLYRIIAGPDASDVLSFSLPQNQPSFTPSLTRSETSLQGWRIGVCDDLLHMTADSALVDNYRANIATFEKAGAKIVSFKIPCFEQMRLAHASIILSEMLSTMRYHERDWAKMIGVGHMSLQVATMFDAASMVQAQKVRSFAIRFFAELFARDIDCFVTPTTACLPPRWHVPGGDLSEGVSDTVSLFNTMIFVVLSNLIGNPALSVPNGYDPKTGLPTALQIMTNFFREEDGLHLATFVERSVSKAKPKVFFDILP